MADGDFGSMFNDPSIYPWLGALAGVGQMSGYSRLPISTGQVLGGLGAGLLSGNIAANKATLEQQQANTEAAKNAMIMNQLGQQAGAFGVEQPTWEQIRKGWTGFPWAKMFADMEKQYQSPAQQALPQIPTAPVAAPSVGGYGVGGATEKAGSISANNMLRNNPGNIKSADGGWRSFPNMDAGIAAIGDWLQRAQDNHGLQTVRQLIDDSKHGYAPSVDPGNAGKKLPEVAAAFIGVDPDAPVNMSDPVLRTKMTQAILRQEGRGQLVGNVNFLANRQQYAQNASASSASDAGGAPATLPHDPAVEAAGLPQVTGLMSPVEAFKYQIRLGAQQIKPSPVTEAFINASMAPPGPMRDLNLMAALKAADIKPFLGGERQGVPISRFNIGNMNYDIAGQRPKTEVGQLTGPHGELYYAPGTLPTIAAGEATKAAAGAQAKVGPAIQEALGKAQATLPIDIQRAGGEAAAKVEPAIEEARGKAQATLPIDIQRAGGEAAAKLPTEITREQSKPMAVSPETSVIIPGAAQQPTVAAPALPAPPQVPTAQVPAAPALGATQLTPETIELLRKGGVSEDVLRQLSAPQHAPGIVRQGLNPIYLKGVEGQIVLDQARIKEELQPQADKANDMMATSRLIRDLMPKVSTGWSAGTRADAARILKALTGSDEVSQSLLGINPTNADALQKQFLTQSSQAVRNMGAREPGSVMQLFAKAYPNIETQPNAIKLLENVIYMQGQRAHDEFALAQAQHSAAVSATKNGGQYQPLTQFTADFTNGAHRSENYLKAAQAMAGDNSAWRGMTPDQINEIIALIPKGERFLAPDGRTLLAHTAAQ